jgi:hypothetical protein
VGDQRSDGAAVDRGNPASCPATDQRGVGRPYGSRCDIGAYEYEYEIQPVGGYTERLVSRSVLLWPWLVLVAVVGLEGVVVTVFRRRIASH